MTPLLRDPDAFDYAVVGALALLFYLQLPWRPAIRRSLRGAVATIALSFETATSVSLTLGSDYAIVLLILFVAVALSAIGIIPYKFG